MVKKQGPQPPPEKDMPFRIDHVLSDELLAEKAAQMDLWADRDGQFEEMEELFSNNRSKEYYEGLVAGYAGASAVMRHAMELRRHPDIDVGGIVAFVSSKLLRLRPSLDLHFRSCKLVASGRTVKLNPVDFAFYAMLARRRIERSDDDSFVRCDTVGLLKEYGEVYSRASDKASDDRNLVLLKAAVGPRESLEKLWPAGKIDEMLGISRKWFEVRKSRVNGEIVRKCGRELGLIYGITSQGGKGHVRSGLAIDRGGIRIHD